MWTSLTSCGGRNKFSNLNLGTDKTNAFRWLTSSTSSDHLPSRVYPSNESILKVESFSPSLKINLLTEIFFHSSSASQEISIYRSLQSCHRNRLSLIWWPLFDAWIFVLFPASSFRFSNRGEITHGTLSPIHSADKSPFKVIAGCKINGTPGTRPLCRKSTWKTRARRK